MGYALYVNTLLHDDRSSNYILSVRCPDGKWSDAASVDAEALKGYESIWFPEQDTYISVNGFSAKRRTSRCLRQKNALVFNLNAHGGDHATAVPQAIAALEAAVVHGLVPKPTMVVSTGRGLQLYYMLQRSIPAVKLSDDGSAVPNERALAFSADLEARIDAALDAHVCALVQSLKVDSRGHDAARVMRVPSAWNSRAGCHCRLIAHSGVLYPLASLKSAAKVARRSSRHKARRKLAPLNSDTFLLARMRAVESLVELREAGVGSGTRTDRCRNEALFAHYNAVGQLLGSEKARERTSHLNEKFSHPLDRNELEGIFRSCEKAGFYKLTNEWIRLHLGITDGEAVNAGLLSSKRSVERAAAKERTAAKRATRDTKIVELRRKDMTQDEITAAVGCSRRTVCTILEREGLMKRKRPMGTPSLSAHARHLRPIRRLCNFLPEEQGVMSLVSLPWESPIEGTRLWDDDGVAIGALPQQWAGDASLSVLFSVSFRRRYPLRGARRRPPP